MNAPVIRVEGLGKRYRMGATVQQVGYDTLRDSIAGAVSTALRRGDRQRDTTPRYFWALKDAAFTVGEGEVLGVIGRNGSGKSTLLKILAGITEPTAGRAEIRGRVASLLEVGTGFHGELTGRENIFLNGAILGMNRREVLENFDRIVDFSSIGKFIDTPVKRYSSGMYLRLAFAVAAHLNPEVLLLDEVLAVGDYEFQQRCIGRMREVAQAGRTVLFVSHNMAAIESLCSHCVLMEGGRVVLNGPTYQMTREYRRRLARSDGEKFAVLEGIESAKRQVPVLRSLCVVDEDGELTSCIPVSRAFEVRIGVRIPPRASDLLFVVRVDNPYGGRMLTLRSPMGDSDCRSIHGDHEVICRVPEFPLAPGDYRIGVAVLVRDRQIDSLDDVLGLSVTDADVFGEGRGAVSGMCVARSEWAVAAPRALAADRAADAESVLQPS